MPLTAGAGDPDKGRPERILFQPESAGILTSNEQGESSDYTNHDF